MRVFILAIALMGLALPAFADCGATHQATNPDTVATTSTTSTPTPAPDPNSGG